MHAQLRRDGSTWTRGNLRNLVKIAGSGNFVERAEQSDAVLWPKERARASDSDRDSRDIRGYPREIN